MKSNQQQYFQQAQPRWRNLKGLVKVEHQRLNSWGLICLHSREQHPRDNQLLNDVFERERKLHRIIDKSFDQSIKGAGGYPYSKMLFVQETLQHGRGDFYKHLIIEKLPTTINKKELLETLSSIDC